MLRSRQRALHVAGTLVVLAILGFVVLPAFVVTLAAFNDKAILAFPPQAWSWRWFAKALAYEDFHSGFGNGLIVTGWASSIALLVGGPSRLPSIATRLPTSAPSRQFC